jgi:hypothetical protein
MRHCLLALLLLVAPATVGSAAAQTDQGLARADAEIVRLPPASFDDLSGEIRQYLERKGCTVPQAGSIATPHNVFRARLITPRQWDTAVLCSKERVSSVLVFRDGKTKKVDELATMSDATFLQALGPGGPLKFSRVLTVSEPDYIKERNGVFAGPKPKFDHEGIDDLFGDNGSVVWYWTAGSWVRLRGQPAKE